MCKRTMYKRARIPMFLYTHAPTVVPRPFFLAPAKTAWERGMSEQGKVKRGNSDQSSPLELVDHAPRAQ